MSSNTQNKKKRGPVSAKTLNLLLAAAIVVMLIPFAIDLYLAKKDSESTDSVHTDASEVYVMDDAGILSNEEISRIKEAMLPITAHFPVAFATTANTDRTSASTYSLKLYNKTFDSRGGILFLIDLDTSDSDGRQLYLRVTDLSDKLTVAKCETITDNIYTYARDGKYCECARQCFLQAAAVLDDHAVPQPMKHMSNLLIAVCAALLGVFVTANLRTRTKTPGEVYLLDKNISKSVTLTNAHSRLVRQYTIKRQSSGGGGFSGGGGGGSHGGGHGF